MAPDNRNQRAQMTDEADHTRLILIENRLLEMQRQMDEQTQATRDLVDAWRSARTLVTLILVLAKVGAACAALWLLVRSGWDLFHR